jgi:two-component system, NarL family, response regulator NreC
MTSLRVVICDDHALVRAGLRRLLETEHDVAVVGEAATAEEGVAAVISHRPDVLLLDVTMPGRSGLDALPDVFAASPETRVLMVSMQDDPAYVRRALAAGADGYLLKEAAEEDLVQAIQDVAAGRRYVHPLLGARLAEQATDSTRTAAAELSERERQVLHLLSRGHTNQEIARQLFISIRTVETHRARLMQKLGLHTRAELVAYALQAGDFADVSK